MSQLLTCQRHDLVSVSDKVRNRMQQRAKARHAESLNRSLLLQLLSGKPLHRTPDIGHHSLKPGEQFRS